MNTRERAIIYARQQELTPDITESMDLAYCIAGNEYDFAMPGESWPVMRGGAKCDENNWPILEPVEADTIIVHDPVRFKIGLDNMIARAFEMGYAAREDDLTPRRSLGGVGERLRRTPRAKR